MRFSITTLGCKVNQYDGGAIAAALTNAGLAPAKIGCPAELVVINTCCVTAAAMRKSRQAIRRAIRLANEPVALVAGCYSDYDGQRIAEVLTELNIPAERMFIVDHHGDLPAVIAAAADAAKGLPTKTLAVDKGYADTRTLSPATIRARRAAAQARPAAELSPISRFPGHQRAFVKVQDGCDAFCSYCIVPFTRARLKWRTIQAVRDECSRLVAAGHREIVLAGVFLGAYGRESAVRRNWQAPPAAALAELLACVAQIPRLWRVRLSSLAPADATDELLDVFRTAPAVAPHLHLPLQSGSRAVLRRMSRQYTAEQFDRTIDRIRDMLDRPAITTDIIVGFPGETDDDFADTLAVAERAGFAKIHAFPFSPIEGTAAWNWRSECPPADVVKQRLGKLAGLETRLAQSYRTQFVGRQMEGLVESARPAANGRRQAMTDRYLTVFFTPTDGQPTDALTGRVLTFDIDAVCDDGLVGRPAT